MNVTEKLVGELLDAIDEKRLNEKTISQFFYSHLYALYYMTTQMQNGKSLFLKIKTYVEDINVKRLKKQRKIQVGFIANYSSTWIGDELYYLFEEAQKFEPYVIVVANYNEQSDEMRREEYCKNVEFFKNKGMRVVETLSEEGALIPWTGVKPQLFIWLTHWADLFKGDYFFLNYSLDTLHMYIPYAFMIADNCRHSMAPLEYNQVIHNLALKNFQTSRSAVEMAHKYAFVGDSNTVYTGYPKMDDFYLEDVKGGEIWDNLLKNIGNNKAKKIIYAPHQTLTDDEPVLFSTFAKNYKLFLNLAEKYQHDTVWIFKPHPLLKFKSVKAGLFANEEEWEEYVSKWKNLKNAAVMDSGDYAGMFMASDAMILDSASFLVEYLYTHRPLLFLRREEQAFNEVGEELLDIHYSVDGNDEQGIDDFINSVVLSGNDTKKNMREQYFEDKYNHRNISGNSASKNIYNQIKRIFA